MPKTINPIRKHKVKNNLLQGKSIRQSLKDSGYSAATAHCKANMTTNRMVKVCMNEIEDKLRLNDITEESILNEINNIKNMAITKEDYATATRCEELKGKYLKMWTERTEIDNKHPDKVIISYVKDDHQANVNEQSKVSNEPNT